MPCLFTVINFCPALYIQLCFVQGWKKEHVVVEYVETGSRIILVNAEDPKYAVQKVRASFTRLLIQFQHYFIEFF